MLAAIDYRESGANPTRAIGQGDPWDRVSVHVPKGYGPFSSKVDADVFYLRLLDLDEPAYPWTWSFACFECEGWNGFGYRSHGVRSPYLWGATNHQQRGKYVADGRWSSTQWDEQIGVVAIMTRMADLNPALSIGPMPQATVAVPSISLP